MRVLWILCLIGSIICAPVEKGPSSNGAETQLPFPWYKFRGTGSSTLGNSSDQAPEHSGSSGNMNFKAPSHPLVTRYESPAAGPDGYVVGQYRAPAVGPDGYVVGQYRAPAVGPDGYVVGQYRAPAVGPDGYVVGQYRAPAVGPDGYVVGQYRAPAAGPDGYVVGQYRAPAAGPDGYVVGQYQAAPVFNSASGTSGEENNPVFTDMSDLDPVYSRSSRSRYQKGRALFAQTRYSPTDSLGLSMPLFPYTSYMFAPQVNPHAVVTTVY